MMKTFDVCVSFDGHGLSRAQALGQARAALTARGTSTWEADDLFIDRPGLVVRAWWGGDDVGFVQEHHDGATPVTVVNVAPPEPRSPA